MTKKKIFDGTSPTLDPEAHLPVLEFLIPCRVTLDGAHMIVHATSAHEARLKAKSDDWDDIIYHQASLVDWETTGEPYVNE